MSELIECIDGLTANQIFRRIAKDGFYLQTKGLSAFNAQYQAVYDAFATKPSSAVASAQNTMVQSLVDGGYWDLLDIFYLHAVHTNGGLEAQLNWKDPSIYLASIHDGIGFTADEGFVGNDNGYVNYNWRPSAHGVNFIQDSASIFVGIYNDIDEDRFICGSYDGVRYSAYLRPRSANNASCRMNSTTIESVGNTASNKHMAFRRFSNNDMHWIINQALTYESGPSTGVSDVELFGMGYNNNGSAAGEGNHILMYLGAGGAMSTAGCQAVQGIIDTYLVSIGKGLLP